MKRVLALPAGLALMLCAFNSACQNNAAEPAPIARGEAPSYAEASARYNARIAGLTRLSAAAVVRIEFDTQEGARRREQGEGRLQVIQPARVALDVGKLSETLLWLGCDSDRYWWMDLTGDERIAYVGRHDQYATSRARSLGVVVHPLQLLGLIGAAPLPRESGGTQWSADGRWLGLTRPADPGASDGGVFVRTWVDPQSYIPQSVEVLDNAGRGVVVAELSSAAPVEVRGTGTRPYLATRARILHVASGSLLTLDLDDLTDGHGRMVDEAFDLRTLMARLRIGRTVDLDASTGPGR